MLQPKQLRILASLYLNEIFTTDARVVSISGLHHYRLTNWIHRICIVVTYVYQNGESRDARIRFGANAPERAPDNFIYQRTMCPASPTVTSEERRCNDDDDGFPTGKILVSLSWCLMAATPTADTERLHNLRAGTPKGTIIRGRYDAAARS